MHKQETTTLQTYFERKWKGLNGKRLEAGLSPWDRLLAYTIMNKISVSIQWTHAVSCLHPITGRSALCRDLDPLGEVELMLHLSPFSHVISFIRPSSPSFFLPTLGEEALGMRLLYTTQTTVLHWPHEIIICVVFILDEHTTYQIITGQDNETEDPEATNFLDANSLTTEEIIGLSLGISILVGAMALSVICILLCLINKLNKRNKKAGSVHVSVFLTDLHAEWQTLT